MVLSATSKNNTKSCLNMLHWLYFGDYKLYLEQTTANKGIPDHILISCPESHFCSSKISGAFSINEEFDLNPECRKLAENVNSSQRFYGFSWVCHQQISMHITHPSSDIFENVKLLQGNWKECKNFAKGMNLKWRLICNSLIEQTDTTC